MVSGKLSSGIYSFYNYIQLIGGITTNMYSSHICLYKSFITDRQLILPRKLLTQKIKSQKDGMSVKSV